MLTRRGFIKSAGITTGGLLAGGALTAVTTMFHSALPDEKHPVKLVVRKDISALDINDPSVKILRDAVGILKKRSPLDPAGWLAHVGYHATFCATNEYKNQMHYNWFLLPWHRGYLYSLEQKLQEAVKEPQLALHYWDWTKMPRIPSHYWGADNPMNNNSRMISPGDTIPYDFLNVGAALRASDFRIFGGYPQVKSPDEQQRDGIAEQTFHNNIHNWIGGDMAGFTNSGNDMIFNGHHGNLDRIWEAWLAYDSKNQNPVTSEWLEHTFYFSDGKGKPIDLKVKDLLSTNSLGYTFDDLDLNPRYCNPLTPDMCPVPGDQLDGEPAELTLSDTQRKILDHGISGKRMRASVSFERLELPYQPYCARVFFEYPGEGKLSGQNQSSYITTFTILPIGKPYTGTLQKDVCIQIEIDETLASQISKGRRIFVRLMPVQLKNRPVPAAGLQLKSAVIDLIS